MYIKILDPDFFFSDKRGQLVQLIHEGYRQVNYILSYAGETRGGHYHSQNKELFYVISGRLELDVKPVNQTSNSSERYIFGAGSMFEVPENIEHSFQFIETTSLISMYSQGVELVSGEKDILRGE